MKTLFKNIKAHNRPLVLLFIACSSLLTSCFGPKNLVTNRNEIQAYDYVGDTLEGWTLVRKDSLWGYVSKDGKKTIKPAFLWATDFADGMALVEDIDGYRYINSQGKLLRRIKASHAYSFAEGLAPIQIKDKWGYIDQKGKVVIKPRFDWAMSFHENRAVVSIGLRKGYINKNGKLIIPAVYEESSAFKNGLAIVRKEFRYGLMDTLGNFVLPHHFDEIQHWEDKYYRLGVYDPDTRRISKLGLADASGNLLLDTVYTNIEIKEQGFIRVNKNQLYGLYDKKGKEIISPEYTQLELIKGEPIIVAEKDKRWGFMDLQGNILLPFEYELPIRISEERIWAHQAGNSILFDTHFQEIKRFSKYNQVFVFSNGYAAVSIKDTSIYSGNLYGFIDRDGNEVIRPQFDGGVGNVTAHGIVVVGIKNHGIIRDHLLDIKTGSLVNKKAYSDLKSFGSVIYTNYGDFLSLKAGQEILDFPYSSIQPLKHRRDLAVVRKERKVGLIDTNMRELLPVEFEDVKDIYQDRMQVKKDGKWGFADEKFRIRIPIEYDEVSYFHIPELTEIRQNKKKGVMDRYGRKIIPTHYEFISFDPKSDRIYAEKSEGIDVFDKEGRLLFVSDFDYIGFYGRKPYVAFRKNDKIGFMDYDFHILLDPTYDRIGSFYNGLAFVVANNRGGYINEDLELVLPVEFDDIEDFALGIAQVKKDGREYFIDTQGQEVTPTQEELDKRDAEIARRKSGWIDFSS